MYIIIIIIIIIIINIIIDKQTLYTHDTVKGVLFIHV